MAPGILYSHSQAGSANTVHLLENKKLLEAIGRRQDTQQNDNQHNDIQQNGLVYNTQHKRSLEAKCLLACHNFVWSAFLLSVTFLAVMLSVIIH